MIEQKIQFNPAQQIGLLLQAKNKCDIWGRGTGKSAGIAWDINLINRTMPRALTAVTGQTFGQLLTRTLPSTFKLLESMGYKMHVSAKDPGNYVINRRPPDHFLQPYEKVMKFDNLLAFRMVTAYCFFLRTAPDQRVEHPSITRFWMKH